MARSWIAYYRVSTAKQGISGLGLEAQQTAVRSYLNNRGGKIIAEFTEIESGRKNDRPALEEALALARLHRSSLVVAKVDRLTRSVGFLSRLLETGIDVCFADLPGTDGPTGRFMLQQMAAVAELEAGLISSRTKLALAAAAARGVRLGGFRGGGISDAARAASHAARTNRSKQRANDLKPLLDTLRQSGIHSASGLARALEERGIPTPSGNQNWSATQVIRALRSLNATK